MAQLGGAINIEEQAKDFRGEFKVLPPGWYTAVVIKSSVDDTKNKDGKVLTLTFQTSDGSEVVDRLNIVNKSEIAQKIGRSALAKIAQEIGIKGTLTDSNVLHGKPIDIKLSVEKFKSNTSDKELDSNKVVDYRKAGSAPAAAEPAKAPAANGGW